MKDKVTRRVFLNGTQVAIGASQLSSWTDVFGANPDKFALGPDHYPPAKTGMRGSHNGAWETMHAKVSGLTRARTSPEEEYDTWEPDYPTEEDKPWVKGRKPYGRITIANSDAGAAANTNSAITHAHRAVQEALSA